MLNRKKAAMFALDARIAMVIFAVLSVVTTASLYGALNNVDSTKTLYEMREVMKAYEAYRVDTRKKLPQISTNSSDDNFYLLNISYFLDNPGIKGWKGPYIEGYSVDAGGIKPMNLSRNDDSNMIVSFMLGNESTVWGKGTSAGNPGNSKQGYCTAGKECNLWIRAGRYDSDDLIKKIDKEVDGSDGPSTGYIKWCMNNAGTWYYYFFKHMPIKNPND